MKIRIEEENSKERWNGGCEGRRVETSRIGN